MRYHFYGNQITNEEDNNILLQVFSVHFFWFIQVFILEWGVRVLGGSARPAPPVATAATTETGRAWTVVAGASTGDTASENVRVV